MKKLVLSIRRILHVRNWFRTGEVKEEYCCRVKPGAVEGKITIKTKIKKNIKTMSLTVKYSKVIEFEVQKN